MNRCYPVNTLLALCLLWCGAVLNAQEEESLVVTRISAINQHSPVRHIFVDDDNVKWVSNALGVFQLRSSDLASPLPLANTEQSLYAFPGGNFDLKWSTTEMNAALGNILNTSNTISAAAYDVNRDELWLGTTNSGVHLLKTKPALRKVETLNTSNSKLTSNHILHIFIDKKRRKWIGSKQGVLIGADGKWTLEQKYFAIQRTTEGAGGIWVAGEGQIWQVDSRDRWLAMPINNLISEGQVKDIAVDAQGNLWIASESIVRYNPDTETTKRFGPADYYTSQYATCMAIDQDGAVWIGTEDKGVFLVEKASALTVNIIKDKELSCLPGQNDAVLRAKVTGGKPPFTYRWNGDRTGETISALGPGLYSVTVNDSQGRSKITRFTIDDTRITARATQQDPESASGAADGVALAVAEGGALPLSYKWSNGEAANIARKLTAGVHTVTITDKNGCSATASVTIEVKAAPLRVQIAQTQALRCAGDNSAALAVELFGGKGPYQFKWSQPNLSGDKVSGLGAGEYSVSVSDATGKTATAQFSVKAPAALALNATATAPASTGQSDGKATAQANGGTAPYSFRWDNGETTAPAERLAPGTRTVTVQDANGCTATATVSITENILPLSASLSQTANLLCASDKSAALEVRVGGGKGPYQFKWSQSNLSGDKVSGLGAGEYSVSVSDATGKTATAQFSVKAPAALALNATATAPASTGQSDGKATAQANGGTAPYSFRWDNGETTAPAERLAPGTRTVTVQDANGCTATATVSITENILPLSASLSQTANLLCASDKNAALEVRVGGGKGPYQFKWSQSNLSGDKVSGLGAGEYSVSVSDATGKTATAQFSVKAPAALALNATATAPASTGQSDGKATAQANGGTAPYSFRWDNGETTAPAERLAPGTRTVTVQDANGCTATATVSITENFLPLSASLSQTANLLCASDKSAALEVRVSGGKGPYQFKWSQSNLSGDKVSGLGAGEYSVSVSDATGKTATAQFSVKAPAALALNATATAPASTGQSDGKATAQANGGTAPYSFRWDNGETTAPAERLAPGTRTVTVQDANGCTATATVSITENILPLSASLSQTANLLCASDKNAALEVRVSGGKGPYQFKWSQPNLSGDKVSGLGAGEYSVSVSDATGKTATAQFSVKAPAALALNATATAPASTGQSDGKATAQANGGTAPYSFRWDNGETTAPAERLAPGTRTVTVQDANGCTATATVSITENILPLSASLSQTANLLCASDKNAALEVRVSGGKGPYQFKWSQSNLSGDKVSGLGAGEYSVSVSDATGKTATAQFSVKAPAALALNATATAPASTGQSDGKATAQANGGTAPYSFRWDNGETTAPAERLAPGTRTVTVQDANGCTATATVSITENILPLSASLSQTANLLCASDKNAALEVRVSGGKGPYQFKWSQPNLSGDKVSGLGAGEYSITVTDAVGNTQSTRIVISQPAELAVSIAKKRGAVSAVSPDGRAVLTVQGGTPPYAYRWDNGEATATAEKLPPGSHTVTVTDANSCTYIANVDIPVRNLPELTAGLLQTGQAVRMEQLQFDADSVVLKPQFYPLLDELYDFLDENPGVVVEIGGHTNNLPPDEVCDRLSTARAKAVADYLIAKGIHQKRVFFKGYGKRQPIASNATVEGRRRNQRVEVKILRLSGEE